MEVKGYVYTVTVTLFQNYTLLHLYFNKILQDFKYKYIYCQGNSIRIYVLCISRFTTSPQRYLIIYLFMSILSGTLFVETSRDWSHDMCSI